MCICNYLATSGLNHHFTVGDNKNGNDLATSRPFFFFGDFQTRLPKIGDFQTGTLPKLATSRPNINLATPRPSFSLIDSLPRILYL